MSTTSAISKSPPRPHVLVFPYPAQGHALALIDLTHQLALQNLTITIITTPKNLPAYSSLLSAHPLTVHALVLPLPSHPSLPAGVENVRELGNAGNLPIIVALGKLFDPIIQWFRSHPNPPHALISDFFLGWTVNLAHQMGIRRFAFFSVGSYLPAVFDHCWNHHEDLKGLEVVDFVDLPRSPSFKQDHLPSLFLRYREGDPDWEFVKDSIIANMSSYGCIFNTFDALEGEFLSYQKNKRMGHERVYAVGPLSLLGPDHSSGGLLEMGSFAHVFNWLDSCPDGSVLYVCFGSQKLMNRQQMEALAQALEKSMARFIWVVKTGITQQTENGYGIVPDGFEERVVGRGLVIRGWAPQVMLLSHESVGGFLSHCGWNSVLEAVVAGVIILAWPMEADQFINARLLVEDMGMGVIVCEGGDWVPNSNEMAKVIATRFVTPDVPEKVKARELRDKALAAVGVCGSSSSDLDRLVHELSKL
uniref:Uncharacterized protein MANES_03G092400 n=1 Tax=Rhizophora mucronata TaxID=61149 RepID=A0A2P2MYG8_RHIMU